MKEQQDRAEQIAQQQQQQAAAFQAQFKSLSAELQATMGQLQGRPGGAATKWFRWMSRNGLITDWERFKESFMNRFGPSKYEDPQGALSKLLQLSTVEEYQVAKPTTLGDVFSLARVTEARLDDQATSVSVMATKVVTSYGGQRQPNTRIEWVRGHKCPGKFLLLMADDEDESLRMKRISLHHMQALLEVDDVYGMYEVHSFSMVTEGIITSSEMTESISPEIEQLFVRFSSLFQVPTTLPPHRTIDHRIHLLPHTKPVNVRTYHYPHYQNGKMEKLVKEMTEQGIIRFTQSSFSSPVLLVKKKDGSYRFCVDYRALNEVTIKDKFPIPIADEMFDELGGANIFTKIDLRVSYGMACTYNAKANPRILRTCRILSMGDMQNKAFQDLKARLSEAPILGLPSFKDMFIVEADASDVGIGVVLMQNRKPLSYFNRKLGPRMCLEATYQKELFAIVEAVYKWQHYLLGCRFTIRTDHRSLKELMQQENETLDELKIIHQKLERKEVLDGFRQEQGMILFRDRYFIGAESKLKELLLFVFHNTSMAEHSGVKKMLVRTSALFYWKGMWKSIEDFIRKCLVCQQTKYSKQVPTGLLQPLPTPLRVWEDVSIDFITGLPVAEVFMDMVVKHHGIPKTIVSDRDPIFLIKFWKQLFEASGTKLNHSTSYHLQTDGPSEVVNRGPEQYLRAMYQYESVPGHLWMLPPPIIPYPSGSTKVAVVEELLIAPDALLRQLNQSLAQAENRMVMQANRKRRDVEYKIRDMVLVKLQPYRQITLAKGCSNKLAKRYYGAFEVLERIEKVAYRLTLPEAKLPKEEYEGHPVEQPLIICDSRVVLHQGRPTRQVLVQWTGSSPEEAAWEYLSEFQETYPFYHLEDKSLCEAYGKVVDVFIPNRKSKAGKVKVLSSIPNVYIILNKEGFADLQISYLGGSWVRIDLASDKSKNKLLLHKGVMSWFDVLKAATNDFGDVVDIEESVGSSLTRKRICVKTSRADNILETFKVVFKGRIFLARAKELFTWTSSFLEYKEEDYNSVDDSVLRDHNNMADILHGHDGKGGRQESENEGVSKTIFGDNIKSSPCTNQNESQSAFVQQSDDPFGINDLLDEPPISRVNELDPSLSHPPGFTPDPSQQVHHDSSPVQHNVNPVESLHEESSSPLSKDEVNCHANEAHSVDFFSESSIHIHSRITVKGGSFLDVLDDMIKSCARDFNCFISSSGLVDVKMEGFSFTWVHPSAKKMSKLDRFLVSDAEFPMCCGLKQGDPLDPLLFILVMETLHISVSRAVNE
nr:hypothetical protein [Tanacetum cinerariifolium]